MTAVASPPSVQSGPRLGWYSSSNGQTPLGSMSADDVSQMFMPRKSMQRSNSSSSTLSTSTVINTGHGGRATNGDSTTLSKKKSSRGLWPPAKSEPVAGVTNARSQAVSSSPFVNGASTASSAMSAIQQSSPTPQSPHLPQSPQQNGLNPGFNGSNDPPAILTLVPLNGTFEKKQIIVPYFPEVLRIGRQTNAKTAPTPMNGYFDSKVLSRQHAEIWADRRGKIWIRDIKSSNGTWVNNQRLSPENRDSEPHELRENDTLELGIDIVSEDQKTIVHHKVSARVEHAGIYGANPNIWDLNFGDIDPTSGGGLLPSPLSQPLSHLAMRNRNNSTSSTRSTQSATSTQMNMLHQRRQLNYYQSPVTIEQLVKRLQAEMKQAKQQSQDLRQTDDLLHSLISQDIVPKKEPSSSKQANGRPKMTRLDSMSRFSDPPAPPPQQPLPEKPDVASRSQDAQGGFKRSDTEKQPKPATGSPVSRESSSQIASLLQALSTTKKELEAQNTRVKELEDQLRREREAREIAEERARQSEQAALEARRREMEAASRPQVDQCDQAKPGEPQEEAEPGKAEDTPQPNEEGEAKVPVLDAHSQQLQQRLDNMVAELAEMRQQVEHFKQRAEKAESETVDARKSLAEMIETIRREREMNDAQSRRKSTEEVEPPVSRSVEEEKAMPAVGDTGRPSSGGIDKPASPVTALQERRQKLVETSTPYASMLGVVLLGVGLMAYLNGWQKIER